MENISIKEAFTYFWSNPSKWMKILSWFGFSMIFGSIEVVLVLLSFIPLVGLALYPIRILANMAQQMYEMSYMYEVAQIVRKGGKEMPEVFQGVKERFIKGFSYWA